MKLSVSVTNYSWPHSIRRQLDVLDGHCADVGRPPEEIERTVTTALEPGESSGRLAERCQTLAGLGIQHAVVIARGRPLSDDDVDTVVDVASQISPLGV